MLGRIAVVFVVLASLSCAAVAAPDPGLVAAAEKGDAASQATLAVLYSNAEGVLRDYKQALHWNQKAAEQGYARAQTNLGFMYDAGLGVARDHQAALGWYEKAALQGDAIAQANLAALYAKGLGAPQDLEEAYFWFSIAARSGKTEVSDAAYGRDAVALRLTPEKLAAAQKRAQAWKPL